MTPDSESDPVREPDAAAVVDALFDYGVVEELPDGEVTTTEEFEHRRSINNDTYLDMDDDAFRDAVANAFGLSPEEASTRIENGDVTPDAVAAFFALQGHFSDLDRETPPRETVAAMAEVVTELSPASAVPGTMRELANDDYREYLAETQDAVVFVFKRDCDPCDATKELLPEIEAVAPPGMSFAAVDGDDVPDLVREFEVEAAPTTLLFADGELAETLRGHQRVETYEGAFEAVYDY